MPWREPDMQRMSWTKLWEKWRDFSPRYYLLVCIVEAEKAFWLLLVRYKISGCITLTAFRHALESWTYLDITHVSRLYGVRVMCQVFLVLPVGSLCTFAFVQVAEARTKAQEARSKAQAALDKAIATKNKVERSNNDLRDLIKQIREFLTRESFYTSINTG